MSVKSSTSALNAVGSPSVISCISFFSGKYFFWREAGSMAIRFSESMRAGVLIFSALCSAPLLAATGGADLLQLYRDALSNDTQYATARAKAEALREKLPQGIAGLLPNIGATANTTKNNNVFTGLHREYNSNGYNVNLTQPLFRMENYIQYSQSHLYVAQADAMQEQARMDLTLRVAQAYFDVLNADENLRAVQANKLFISEQLMAAQHAFKFGTATITDTHEAQARYDLVAAQEIAALSELKAKYVALRVILGKRPGALKRLGERSVMSLPAPPNEDAWIAAAETDNFAVLAQQAALGVAEKEVERNRAGHLPTLDLVANYGQNNSGVTQYIDSRTEVSTKSIGVQLTIPIFQGGAVSSKVREAVAGRDAARSELEEAQRMAGYKASEAYLAVESGISQVRAIEAALASSLSALDSNKKGYKYGIRTNADVLDAEQQVYVARRELAKARFETLLAKLRLKAAVGSLTEDDLLQMSLLFSGGVVADRAGR